MANFPFSVGDSLRIGSATISATGNAVVLPAGTQVGNQSVATSTDVSTGGGPKITDLQVTSNVYVVLDDTAVDLAGGFIKLTGTNFVSGCMVYVASTPANSTTFVSTTEVRAALPATAAGTYPVYLVNPDGGTAIRVPGVTFSASPAWQTASSLGEQYDGVVLSLPVVATDATVYTLSSGSLPPGLSLNSNTGVISGTVTGVANDTVYSFTITATDAQNQDSPRTFTVTITVSDPYFRLTTLLLGGEQGNTIVRDSSTNNFNLTVFGDSRATNFTPYNQAWSVYFDGTGDYLQVPYSATNDLGTGGNWTVELWFYMPLIPGDAMDLIGASNGGGNVNKWFLAINMNTSFTYTANRVGFFTYNSADRWLNAAYTWAAGTWYHIAAVYDSTNTTLYVNGQSVGSMAYNASSSSSGIRIGSDGEAFKYFTGYISNTRVVKGTALYTANFTPATTTLTAVANTSLLTCHANRFRDASTNNFVITRNGDAAVRSFNPFNITNTGDSGSMYFDGTGDYLSVADNDAWHFGSGNFTIEAWYYPTTTSAQQIIVAQSTGVGGGTALGWVLMTSNDSNVYLRALVSADGSGWVFDLVSSSKLQISAWNHVAFVRNGTTFQLYLNGAAATSGSTTSSSTLYNTTTPLTIGASNAPNQYVTGYVSGVHIVKGTAIYTGSTYTVPTSSLTPVANTQLLTLQYRQPHNNHGFQDSSSNNFLITRSGNATQGTFSPFSQTWWSNYFDGSGDYLSIANNTAFDLSSSDFTVEAWVYRTGDSGAYTEWILGKRSTSSGDGYLWSWNLGIGSSNFATFGNYNGGVASTTAINLNTWYHIAVTRISGAYKLYVNGLLEGTNAGFAIPEVNVSLTIGNYPVDNPTFTGYISNIRVIKGNGLYTANFTPATTTLTAVANTSLLTCQSNRFIDNSSNNFTITVNGDTRVAAWSPFAPTAVYSPAVHGGSAYFDGTGDYLSVASNPALDLNGDYTVECWFYANSFASDPAFFGIGGDGNGLVVRIVSSKIYAYFVAGGNVFGSSVPTLTLNSWTHIAIVRSGSTNTCYINGAQSGTTYSSSATVSSTGGVGIGKTVTGTAFTEWNGYVSSLRVVKGTALYTANFTPAVTTLTAVANTSLLLNFTDAAILDRTGRNAIETVADARTSSVQVKYGTGAMSFDGTGDYLLIQGGQNFTFGTGDFTIEMWIYVNSGLNTDIVYYDGRPTSTNGLYNIIYTNSTGKLVYSTNSADRITGTTTVLTGTWYHIALSRSGTSTKLFLNGNQEGSTYTDSNSYIIGTSRPVIGGNGFTLGNAPLNGYIDDLRITKFARYTANFPAPTVAHRLK